MSVVNTMLAQGEQSLLASGHGDDLTVISGKSTGKKFTARLDVEPSIDPNSPWGNDTRMSSFLRMPIGGPALDSGDRFTDGTTKWKVLSRENNASSITTDYRVEQQI